MPSADDIYEAYQGVVDHLVSLPGPSGPEMMILRSQAKIGREKLKQVFSEEKGVRKIKLPNGKIVDLVDPAGHIKPKEEA